MDLTTITDAFAHLIKLYPALALAPFLVAAALSVLRHIRVSRHSRWALLSCRVFGECDVAADQPPDLRDTQPLVYGNGLLALSLTSHLVIALVVLGKNGLSADEWKALVSFVVESTAVAGGVGSTVRHQVQKVERKRALKARGIS
jgi:hypothetical protein